VGLNEKLDEIIQKLDEINNQLTLSEKKGMQSNMMLAAAIVLYGVPLLIISSLATHWIINESYYLSSHLFVIGAASVLIVLGITVMFFNPIFDFMQLKQLDLEEILEVSNKKK